jgi:hypothetical protein
VPAHRARLRHIVWADGGKAVPPAGAHVDLAPVGVEADDLRAAVARQSSLHLKVLRLGGHALGQAHGPDLLVHNQALATTALHCTALHCLPVSSCVLNCAPLVLHCPTLSPTV